MASGQLRFHKKVEKLPQPRPERKPLQVFEKLIFILYIFSLKTPRNVLEIKLIDYLFDQVVNLCFLMVFCYTHQDIHIATKICKEFMTRTNIIMINFLDHEQTDFDNVVVIAINGTRVSEIWNLSFRCKIKNMIALNNKKNW